MDTSLETAVSKFFEYFKENMEALGLMAGLYDTSVSDRKHIKLYENFK
jgi:hypothetical protein